MVQTFVVKLFLNLRQRRGDLEIFLENNRHVRELKLINDNHCFCTDYTYYVDTHHESERDYMSFIKGLRETFPIHAVLDFQIL